MEEIYNHIQHTYTNIYYIGIGSARNKLQQHPPYLDLMLDRGKTITIINVDIKFEENYLSILGKDVKRVTVSENMDVYQYGKITYIFIEHTFDDNDNDDITFLDLINRHAIINDSLLLCGNYTGVLNITLENYFYNVYRGTEYETDFSTRIHYNYLFGDNTCSIDVTKVVPFFDDNFTRVYKLDNVPLNDTKDLLTILIDNESFLRQYQIFIKESIQELFTNHIVKIRQHLAADIDATIMLKDFYEKLKEFINIITLICDENICTMYIDIINDYRNMNKKNMYMWSSQLSDTIQLIY
jgi:hypothetical protein